MKPEHFEDPAHKEDKAVLVWYRDRYLKDVVGSEYWDENRRHYKLETDKIPIGKNNKPAVCCTAVSVAFGLMNYANCRDKWVEIFELKRQSAGK